MKARLRCLYRALAVIVLVSLLSFSSPVNAGPLHGQAKCEKAKLGVLIIHGMGDQPENFAEPFIERLNGKISFPGFNENDICWQTIYWADILSGDESNLWDSFSPSNDLGSPMSRKIREYVINFIGDALAYRHISDDPEYAYNLIHKSVHDSILELRKRLVDEKKPIIIMAHSMGSVIMSDYIWDRQNWDAKKKGRPDPYGGTCFERMGTLAGFITFGSPIALYTLAYDKIYCVKFPPDTLCPELKKSAKWWNFYSRHDVLGWPLNDLGIACPRSESGEVKLIEDKPIDVGGPLTWWNPISHHEYWADDNFVDPAAQYVAEILQLCPLCQAAQICPERTGPNINE